MREEYALGNYPKWFNDSDICYGNSHHIYPYTLEQAKDYILSAGKRTDIIVLAIIDLNNYKHIGNVSLGSINPIYRTAEFAIVIGERDYWKKNRKRSDCPYDKARI